MHSRAGFQLRQVLHDLNVSLLFRPAIFTVALAALAPLLTSIEAHHPAIGGALTGAFPWLCGPDVTAAQLVLTTIAGSMMTVLSLTYSVLLMALSLASMQFSPRILFGFLRDKTSQTTLGFFIGTFLYCLLLLRLVHGAPEPFIPQLGMVGSLALALLSLGWLLYFIHHIAQGIQANHLVARIAAETAAIIDDEFPEPLGPGEAPAESQRLPIPEDLDIVVADRSGYIQLTDDQGLIELARASKVSLYLHRGPGEFVTEGTPLLSVAPTGRLSPSFEAACREAFDLGEIRTMQQDVEYGLRQVVDVALKAISPAVNDPSTAVTCLDNLGVLLARLARRREPPQQVLENGAVLVQFRRTTFRRVVDLAFNQIRQYGRGDMAVVLRMYRALEAVAQSTRHRPYLDAIERQAGLIDEASRAAFLAGDGAELEARRAALSRLLAPRKG